jgi:hypothetical protein
VRRALWSCTPHRRRHCRGLSCAGRGVTAARPDAVGQDEAELPRPTRREAKGWAGGRAWAVAVLSDNLALQGHSDEYDAQAYKATPGACPNSTEPGVTGDGRRTTAGYPSIPGRPSMRMTDPIPKIAVYEPTGIAAGELFRPSRNSRSALPSRSGIRRRTELAMCAPGEVHLEGDVNSRNNPGDGTHEPARTPRPTRGSEVPYRSRPPAEVS